MSGAARRRVRVLIPVGLGLNCEEETAHAFRTLGVEPDLVHLTDLLTSRHERRLSDYHLVVFIGGFSYGDHVAGGLVLATRLRAHLLADLEAFLERGGLALGICNGFQALVRLGLVPGPDDGRHDFVQRADLGPNDRLGYRDAWVRLRVDARANGPWTHGLDELELPARHGEGKFLVPSRADLERLGRNGQIAFRYVDDEGEPTERWPSNPNGSSGGVAGVTDHTGRILGLMPHPDAFLHPWHHPRWRHGGRGERGSRADGLELFRAGLSGAAEIA